MLISEKVGGLLMRAIKDKKDQVLVSVLRSMKSEFALKTTSKGAKPLTEEDEFTIIKKMIKQREESVRQYTEAGRPELADNENEEIIRLRTFLPEAPSIDEMREGLVRLVDSEYPFGITKNQMGIVIKAMKSMFPAADGKEISDLVKSFLV